MRRDQQPINAAKHTMDIFSICSKENYINARQFWYRNIYSNIDLYGTKLRGNTLCVLVLAIAIIGELTANSKFCFSDD